MDLYNTKEVCSLAKSVSQHGIKVYKECYVPESDDPRHSVTYGIKKIILGENPIVRVDTIPRVTIEERDVRTRDIFFVSRCGGGKTGWEARFLEGVMYSESRTLEKNILRMAIYKYLNPSFDFTEHRKLFRLFSEYYWGETEKLITKISCSPSFRKRVDNMIVEAGCLYAKEDGGHSCFINCQGRVIYPTRKWFDHELFNKMQKKVLNVR